MEIEFLNSENKQEWNDFCVKTNASWFRHTTDWQEYILNCRFDSNCKNLSFMVRQNSQIVAVIPLISQYIYGDEKNDEFANYDSPTPYFAIKNDNDSINRETLIKFINQKIDDLAKEHNIKKSTFFIDPLINANYLESFKEYNLLKYDYVADVTTTNIIDLKDDLDTILRQMRKGHKADIKAALKGDDYRIDIFDNNNFTEDKMEIFKKIHCIDAGRQTRTDKSWDCMSEFVKNNNAFLILVWIESLNQYCAGGFFLLYKQKAYYGSYATIDSGLLNAKLGYLVQWNAIQYLKSNNYQKYETGCNFYNSSVKEMEISKFKRGFGGDEILRFNFKKEYK